MEQRTMHVKATFPQFHARMFRDLVSMVGQPGGVWVVTKDDHDREQHLAGRVWTVSERLTLLTLDNPAGERIPLDDIAEYGLIGAVEEAA